MIGALRPVLSSVLRHPDGQQYDASPKLLLGACGAPRPLGVAPAGHPALRPVLLVVGDMGVDGLRSGHMPPLDAL